MKKFNYRLNSFEDAFVKIENDDEGGLSFEWKCGSFVDVKRIEDALNIYKYVVIALDKAMKEINL